MAAGKGSSITQQRRCFRKHVQLIKLTRLQTLLQISASHVFFYDLFLNNIIIIIIIIIMGGMTKILYHDNNIYHDIVIIFILKSLIPYNCHNPCHQYQTNISLKREN